MKTARVRKFSAHEVANLCGVVNQTAINWINKNYLPAHRTPGGQYRVYGEDLAGFMSSRGMRLPEELKNYTTGRKKRALIIDDDRGFANRIVGALKAEYPDFETDRAGDGFEAGIKLAGGSRDLILLNCDMNGLNAIRVCESIRRSAGGKNTSIIAYTSDRNKKAGKILLQAGADVYLSKPFDMGHISIYLERKNG